MLQVSTLARHQIGCGQDFCSYHRSACFMIKGAGRCHHHQSISVSDFVVRNYERSSLQRNLEIINDSQYAGRAKAFSAQPALKLPPVSLRTHVSEFADVKLARGEQYECNH